MTDLQRQFIEASARVMWEQEQKRIGVCPECAEAGRTAAQCGVLIETARASRDQPLWSEDQRDQAAMFLGALQQANDCELEEIVRAASEVGEDSDCQRCGDPEGLHCWRSTDPRHFEATEAGGVCTLTHCQFTPPTFDTREFARILTLQALGEPVRWEDEHAAFMLPLRWIGTQYGATQSDSLIVPSIRLEKETAEVKG